MPSLEFVGQSAQDSDNIGANPSRLVNLYRERVAGRSEYVLKSVLGTRAFTDLDGVFMRAMREVRANIYAAHGGNLTRINKNGVATFLANITDSPDTVISSNNGAITVTAGGQYYVWDDGLTEPTGGAFTDFGDVTFMGQRTVLLEREGRRFQWTGVADPTSLDGLDFATTEQRDDNNLRALPIGGLLWIFKETSIERWQQSATGFSPLAGSAIDRGLKAKQLIAEVPNGAFFVGNDNRAYMATAGTLSAPLTIPAVETSLEQNDATHCFFYSDEGHEFCVIRFSDRPAWVFDMATAEWHERADDANDPWSAVAAVRAFGREYVGTDLGRVLHLSRTNSDVDAPLIRSATSLPLRIDGDRFKVSLLEFLGRLGRSDLGLETAEVLSTAGFAVDSGDGSALVVGDLDPTPREANFMLETSKDYGLTFSAPKVRSMGNLGEYNKTLRYRALGQFRDMVVRASMSDATELTLDATATVKVA